MNKEKVRTRESVSQGLFFLSELCRLGGQWQKSQLFSAFSCSYSPVLYEMVLDSSYNLKNFWLNFKSLIFAQIVYFWLNSCVICGPFGYEILTSLLINR